MHRKSEENAEIYIQGLYFSEQSLAFVTLFLIVFYILTNIYFLHFIFISNIFYNKALILILKYDTVK